MIRLWKRLSMMRKNFSSVKKIRGQIFELFNQLSPNFSNAFCYNLIMLTTNHVSHAMPTLSRVTLESQHLSKAIPVSFIGADCFPDFTPFVVGTHIQ